MAGGEVRPVEMNLRVLETATNEEETVVIKAGNTVALQQTVKNDEETAVAVEETMAVSH